MESNTPMMIATRHPAGFRRGLLVTFGACHLFLALTLASAAHAVDIPFTLDKPGRTSLAVYSADGAVQLRSLLVGERLEAGKHAVSWDGLAAEKGTQLISRT